MLANCPAEQIRHADNQPVQIERFRIERLAPAESEQAAGENSRPLHAAHGAMDETQHRRIFRRQMSFQRFDIPANHGEEIVEVVGDAAGELADRFHLLRLPKLFLRRAAFGEIPGDLRKADEPPVVIMYGVDDDARPEPLTAFANAPALHLVLPCSLRRVQRKFRDTVESVFLGVEYREVLADDFLLGITLDPFCPGVPTDNVAMRVECEDRVVSRAFYKQTEAALGFSKTVEGGGDLSRPLIHPLFQRFIDAPQFLLCMAPADDFAGKLLDLCV